MSVRGEEISNTLPKHPIQELERRVNALEGGIKTEVGRWRKSCWVSSTE